MHTPCTYTGSHCKTSFDIQHKNSAISRGSILVIIITDRKLLVQKQSSSFELESTYTVVAKYR